MIDTHSRGERASLKAFRRRFSPFLDPGYSVTEIRPIYLEIVSESQSVCMAVGRCFYFGGEEIFQGADMVTTPFEDDLIRKLRCKSAIPFVCIVREFTPRNWRSHPQDFSRSKATKPIFLIDGTRGEETSESRESRP